MTSSRRERQGLYTCMQKNERRTQITGVGRGKKKGKEVPAGAGAAGFGCSNFLVKHSCSTLCSKLRSSLNARSHFSRSAPDSKRSTQRSTRLGGAEAAAAAATAAAVAAATADAAEVAGEAADEAEEEDEEAEAEEAEEAEEEEEEEAVGGESKLTNVSTRSVSTPATGAMELPSLRLHTAYGCSWSAVR